MKQSRHKPKKLSRGRPSIILIVLILVITSGTSTFILIKQANTAETPVPPIRIAKDDDFVLVPTPTRVIARGEKLSNVEFTSVRWPKDQLRDAYVVSLDEHQSSIALISLPKFLPVPVSAVGSVEQYANTVVEAIPEGMRAIAVRVNAESAVEGWARPGDFVDVILIRTLSGNNSELDAKVIATNVKILSAGQSATPQGETKHSTTPATVTLLTSQEDALKISTASNLGKLTFSLRGRGDDAPTTSLAMNQNNLLGSSRSLHIENTKYSGYARGHDGKLYVLKDNAHWIRTSSLPTTASNALRATPKKQMTLQDNKPLENSSGSSDEHKLSLSLSENKESNL